MAPFKDRLLKCLSPRKDAVILGLNATETVAESMKRIRAYPPSMLHLGRAMMASLLLQALSDAEEPETLSLQWMAKGPFGSLFSEARGQGQVRGTIENPQAEVEDLSTKLGPGILQVRRSHPDLKLNLSNTGHIEARGDVSEDIVEYLDKSEQRSCGLQLFVKIKYSNDAKESEFPFYVERAVGYLIHVLPSSLGREDFHASLTYWDKVMKDMGPLGSWHWGEKTDPALQILQFMTADPNPDIILDSQIQFSCTCSEDRASRALALADKLEPESAESRNRTDKAILKCEFCGLVYEIPLLKDFS